MSNNIFSNAVRDANLSVRVNTDGLRSVGRGSAAMDRESTSTNRNYNSRGRGRGTGGSGGRWQRGGGRWQRGRGFRGGTRGGRGRGHVGRTEDEEGDYVMNESRNSYGAYPHGGSRDGRRERSPELSSQRTSSGWWKVTVIDGRKHSRDWLLRRIKAVCRLPFRELNFRIEGNNSIFFINDESVVGPLEDASNRITTKDGSKIIIQVAPSDNTQRGHNPNTNQNETLDAVKLQQLQACLGARFEPSSSKLNLSTLFSDQLLRNANIQGNVAQPQFMNKVLDLIHSFCPNLKILDLSNNRIYKLDNLTILPEKCPELDELILSNNAIRFTGELTKIKEHKKITKIWFKDNPGQLQFGSNHSAYLADVRKRLPNITMLDGVELPAIIKFELEPDHESHVPARKDIYAANTRDLELVKVFVQNFFNCYDRDDANDRQNLLDAYHNDAAFSLCCNSSLQTSTKSNSLTTYIKNSRNLKNIKDSKQKKASLIKHKKLNIVAFLTELPQTKHWLDSFSLDLTLTTLHMLCFTVQGIFFEGKDEIPRGFSRTFIGQRESDAMFLVVNDQLHIRNLTDKQLQIVENAKYNNVPAPTEISLNVPAPAQPHTVYTEAQQELVKSFSAESKMNLRYSLLCLESAKWDYQQAAMKFMEVNKTGGIPADAFVHT